MIRHYASTATVKTTEGDLPKELYTAHDDGVHGLELLSGPLRYRGTADTFWRFTALAGQAEIGLNECPMVLHTRWLQLWDKAIAAAKTPPAKIAKLGEVWEYVGGPGTFPNGLFYVASRSALVPHAMLYMDTGTLLLLSVGAQVKDGIQLESPNDWTCHGRLADLIRGQVMTTATHWTYSVDLGGGFEEGHPMEDPIAAARAYLDMEDMDACREIRELVFIQNAVHVKLVGMANDPCGPTEEELEGDFASELWNPGATWYRKTGETRTVEVSLAFRLVEAT